MYNSKFASEMEKLVSLCLKNNQIDPELYVKYNVKKGLRDLSGRGVLVGLTNISEICAWKNVNGEEVPCEGKLYYRGIDVEDIINGFSEDRRFGFEEVSYLLLFGELPTYEQLETFNSILAENRDLPKNFVRDIIMKAPSPDMMNILSRGVLTLYYYDQRASDNSIENVLRQSLELIAKFPLIACYGYQTYRHRYHGDSLFINRPEKELSTAENILHLLRKDSNFTKLEARVLDISLMLHADHGGGNNSTFTTRVVTSTGSDTYSVISAALSSLKGPKHGGANIKVVEMFEDMKKKVKDWKDDEEIIKYLNDLLEGKAYDGAGLIYGMGHAVYSKSDPRAEIFRSFVKSLAEEKGYSEEFELYAKVEKLAPEVIRSRRKMFKGVCANVDFYSGFVYSMLGLPKELYTPLFAIARISGWCAHRIEELIGGGKIIRPSYKSIAPKQEYIPIDKRG
ncbi:MAG: Uncharacterized protein XD50_1684 [Clostridia bacterium 41_269]|nr:MAG: Uncharacterized protein XD50_1684 [Clostridia bacterium 41_269]